MEPGHAPQQSLCCQAAHRDAHSLAHLQRLHRPRWPTWQHGPGEQLAECAFGSRPADPRWLEDHGHKYDTITGTLQSSVTEASFRRFIVRRSRETCARCQTQKLPPVGRRYCKVQRVGAASGEARQEHISGAAQALAWMIDVGDQQVKGLNLRWHPGTVA